VISKRNIAWLQFLAFYFIFWIVSFLFVKYELWNQFQMQCVLLAFFVSVAVKVYMILRRKMWASNNENEEYVRRHVMSYVLIFMTNLLSCALFVNTPIPPLLDLFHSSWQFIILHAHPLSVLLAPVLNVLFINGNSLIYPIFDAAVTFACAFSMRRFWK